MGYFCDATAESFENVKKRAQEAAGVGAQDHSPLLRGLDQRQRNVLGLFRETETVASRDVATLFTVSQRSPEYR